MTQLALSSLVMALAVSAVVVSVRADPDPGVSGQMADGLVTYVVPGSPAWRDGIRSGQRLVELTDAGAPGGWRIVTLDGDVTRGSSGIAQTDVLRLYVWWSLPVLGFAALVGFLGYRRNRATAPLLPLALALAAQPLLAVGRADVITLSGLATFVGGGLCVAAYSTRRALSAAGLVLGLVLGTAWAFAIIVVPQAFDPIDGLRGPVAFTFAVLGFASVVERTGVTAFITGRQGVGFVDWAYLAAGLGLALSLAVVVGVPLPLVVAGGVAGVIAYPFWRRRTLAALDRALTAPARAQAVVRAVEDERGRLAREIHDAPLQELTGVIRRLESLPGAEIETNQLRDVAAHLREVATTLLPPVLQDLGLAAAVEDHAEQLATRFTEGSIRVSIDDLTGDVRPPSEVELAAFRIVQEALANSLIHSSGTVAKVEGAVASDSIDITVTDDGVGFDGEAVRAARRAGHFGLDSMRERAKGVGASCDVLSRPGGVIVDFHWIAPG
jgi:signal transduction histidine kinase